MSRGRIGFLACETTMPGSPYRRADSHEHDQEVAALRAPLLQHGIELVQIAWEAKDVDWSQFDAVLVRSTWNYQNAPHRFMARLEEIEAFGTPVWNSPAMIRWNLDKRYLVELKGLGVPVVPTVHLPFPTEEAIEKIRETWFGQDIIVKLQVGAGAAGQMRFPRGSRVRWHARQPAMVQPFMPSILHEGEWSFIFVEGRLSHALIKQAASGDYRVQSLYGGREQRADPTDSDIRAARFALAAVPGAPLYARVDMVRSEEGRLLLMELELTEPFLYPLQGPGLGPLLADAIARRLFKASFGKPATRPATAV